MSNLDRKNKRYERRKAERDKKKSDFLNSLPSYDEVFTIDNLLKSSRSCCSGVRWKRSIQAWEANVFTNVAKLHDELMNGTYKSKGFHEFNIHERGKYRHIRAVDISERVVQRCLCDNYYVPLLSHYLIYDNGASLKYKGTDFALNRITAHLQQYYRQNGNEGYIVLYDFENYFGNIDHDILYSKIDPLIVDERIRKLVHHFIDNFGDCGLGLGSQVSQVSAVFFPTELDLEFKKRGFKYYGRYMDDGYIIVRTREEAKLCKKILYEKCAKLNIVINQTKIGIHKIGKTFTWLKKRIFLTETGEVVMRVTHKSMIRTYRKMRKLAKKGLKYIDALNCLKSKIGSMKRYKAYCFIQRMYRLFNELYIYSWIRITS